MYYKSGDDFFNKEPIRIQIVGKYNYFLAYRDALVRAFKNRGFDAIGVEKIDLSQNPDIVLVIGPEADTGLYNALKDKKILSCALFTEQMYSREIGFKNRGMIMAWNTYKESRFFDIAFDWSVSNCKVMEKWHDRVVHFPHSYYPELEIAKEIPERAESEKYDICFIGDSHDGGRRQMILDWLKSKYNVYPVSEGLWGDIKAAALKESKIYLNIHQDEGLVMENPRLYDYFANECFVLSEPIKYLEPFKVGEDLDTFYPTDLCKKIDFYLDNETERKKIAKHAYQKVREYPINRTVDIMINEMLMEMYYRKYKGNIWTKTKNLCKNFLRK